MAYAVHNFDYNTPTRLLFGRGKIERLPDVAAEFGKKVLLVYGGGGRQEARHLRQGEDASCRL